MVVLSAGCIETSLTPPVTTATTATTAETPSSEVTSTSFIPNLVGVWTGTMVGHTADDGFRESQTSWYNITEQKGQSFTGYKVYIRPDGTEHQEILSGVISFDGKTIHIAEHYDGSICGKVMGANEIELSYLESGEDAKAFLIHVTREVN